MARIQPLKQDDAAPSVQAAFQEHVKEYNAKITNMKGTLGHSLIAFTVYMQWYPLYERVKLITGERAAYLFAHAISTASDCPLCSTFFRRIMIEAGDKPENLVLTSVEKKIVRFGSAIAQWKGNIVDYIYNDASDLYTDEELVVLIAFAGQMIATNIFNNVIETQIDEYLVPYLPKSNSL